MVIMHGNYAIYVLMIIMHLIEMRLLKVIS